MSHSHLRRVGKWPLFAILIQLLFGGTLLRGQALGPVSTVAGQCSQTGYVTEPTQATANKLGNGLGGVATDASGNFYFADTQNNRVRQVNTSGVINTVAGGGGGNGFGGDGGLATAAAVKFAGPLGVAVDASGTIYVADSGNNRVRSFTVGGNINTVVGVASGGTAPSLTPTAPLSVSLKTPTALAFDKTNNLLYITDNANELLKWDLGANQVTVVVGNKLVGGTNLAAPTGVALSATGVPYIAESGGAHIISKFQSGTYTIVAGGGGTTVPPTGASSVTPPTNAKLTTPSGVAFDSSGFLYATDKGANQLYKIDLTGNSIIAVAGTGSNGCADGAALSATLQSADGIAITSSNRVYVAEDAVAVVRTMSATGPPASVSVVSGSPQSATVGATFASPFVVVVQDAVGNPLSGITVTFASSAETVSPASSTTNSSGQVQTTVTASTTAGSYTVTASVAGVATPATGNFTNLAGPVATLTFTTPPSNTTAGATITPAVVVKAADNNNNAVSGVTITLSLQGGSGTLSGTASAVTGSTGLATFANLSVNKTGTYTLKATDGTHFATSASFVINPAATASITTVAGGNQSAPIQSIYASQLKASVQDGLGNPIPNVSVTFAAPPSGASVTFGGPSIVTTDATGVAVVTVTANNQIGSFQVNATAAGAGAPAVFSLNNVAGSASALKFIQQPTNTVAGAVITPAVTVQIQDSLGNNVPQAGISVTLALNPASGQLRAFSGTTSVTTNASGLATFNNLSVSTAGSYQLTATAPSLTSAQSNAFSVSAGAPSVMTAVSGTPQSTTVYGPFALPLKVQVTDSSGNPVSGVTVSFTAPSSGASATLSAASAVTDSTGQTAVSATANATVGTYNVTASAGGLSATFALTNVASSGASLEFSQEPTNTTAGAVMTPVAVRVTDVGGNPSPGVTVSLSLQGGSGVLSGATPQVTDASGFATFSNLSVNITGTYSLQASANSLNINSTSFTISPGTAASITVVAGSGQSAPVGSFYASPLKASVQDALGNGIPNVQVTFSAPATGPSVTFTGSPTVATDSTGVASISVTANAQVGGFQVNATAPGTPSPAVFALTNIAGTASRLLFVQQPSDTAAGATIAPPITVQITDNVGNNIALPGIAVTLTLNPVAGRLRSVSGSTVANTNANGLATFSNIGITSAGAYQFTASASSIASVQSNTFHILAGPPAAIQETAGTPQSATVLSPFAIPLQATVTDSLGNPLSGIPVIFTAPSSGASATLSATSATTDANGHVSVTATANAVVGSYTVTASVSGVSPSASFALTNVGGSGSNLVFTQQPANTTAGAVMAPVVVRETDSGGNPVSGVTISLTAQGGSGVLSGATPTVTNSSGLATFSNLSINLAGTYALQATDGTRFATSASFVIGPGTASSITVVSGSGQSAAVTTNYASQLKASVQDPQGNGVPGITVTFSAPGGGPSVTFSGPATVTTDSTGVAAVSVTANSQVGAFQVQATAAGVTGSAVFSLTNVAGSASQLKFVQQPINTPAGAIVTPPVTVQLTDSVGSPIAQSGVTVTVSANPSAGRLRSTSGTVANTDASGLATFSTLSISTAGNYQLTASGASLVSAQSNQFTITAGAAATIQETAGTPQSATVLAPFAVPLQVLVTDPLFNPLTGVTVTFTAPTTGASATLSASTATTDAAGHASVTATANSTTGSYTVTASVSGVTPSASFALTNLGGTGSNLVFTQQPVDTPAGATMPPVVVKVTDSGGNPVSGVTIALSAQGGPGVLPGGTTTQTTGVSGLATFTTLSIDKTGTYSLQATDGTRYTTSASFAISPGTSSSLTIVAGDNQSTAVTTNYAIPLKVSAQDSFGNAIPGVSITFTAPASGPSVTFLGSPTVSTDGSGVAGIFVTANSQLGTVPVTAAASVGQATFNLTNLPGSASVLKFVQQPTGAVAGSVITPPITVQLTDNIGDIVSQAGVAVTLSLNPVVGRVPTVSGNTTIATNASGLATFAGLSIDVAGSYQFTAIAASLVSAQSNPFAITAGPAAVIQTVAGTPQSTTVLAPFAAPLQVLVTDSLANPISGVTVSFTGPSSGASATLSAATATTDANGNASVTAVANATTGSYTVTASVTGVSPSASFALTNLGGSGANLVFTQQPANATAGAVMAPVVVRETDSGGNPVSGVTISLTAQGGSGVLSGATPTVTNSSGLATFSNLSINLAGTYALQATDGTRFATSASFVIGPGTASSITVVSGSGQSAAVTTNYASQLKASVQDAQGNGVPGIAVTFAAPGSGPSVTFSGPATVTTESTGVAAISVAANSQVGAFQANATAPGTTGSAVFSLTNVAGSASQLRFVQQPSNAAAGAVIAPPITVQITDNLGDNIAQAGVSVTLSLNPVVGRLPVVSGSTTAVTNASGLATFAGLSIDTAGSYQFNAIATSLVSAQSNSFTISAGPATAIQAVSGTPQSTTVFAPFAVPLQVLLTDSLSNPLSGVTVTFTAPASGASATLSATTATTGADGHASVTAVANGVAGAYTVTASASGVSTPASFTLTNLGGAGSNLVFTIQPANSAAGTILAPVTVRFTDNGGNPVSGVTIALSAQGGPGTLSGAIPVVTDTGGLATFSNLSIDRTGTYALQATDGTRFTTSVSFAVTPATSSSITVVAGNGQSAAVTTGYASQLKASVQDAQGNGVPNVMVTFSAPASGPSVSFSGPATVATDSTGVAAISATANSQVGSFQVNATAASISTVFSLTNVAGTASQLKFVQQPTDAVAGAVIAPPITVQLIDSVGNSVAMAGVAVTLSLNPTTGRLPAVSGTTTIATDASGLATFAGLSINTAGSQQFTAIAPSLVSVQSNAFTITAGVPATIQAVSGTPQSTTVLAPFAVPLQALVTDSNNNPLSGVTVTFTAPASGASATLSAATATTDANGYASVSAVASTAAGAYTVTASVSGVSPSASFALTNVGGSGANLAFTQQPVDTPAGASMSPVVAKVTDNGGNPVSGVTISLTAQGGPGALSGATPVVSNASGLATFTSLSIDKTGTYSLQATDGIHLAISTSFVIGPGTSSSITIVAGSGQSAAVTTSYASRLRVSVQDALGNGIPNVTVTFTAPASGPSVTFSGPAAVTTNAAGQASIAVTANTQVGSVSVTAAASTGQVTFSLTNVAGSASQLTFVQQPSNAAAGAVIAPPITVQVTDNLGDNVAQAGVAVTLSLNPVVGRLPVVSGTTTAVTNASGLATFAGLSIDEAGSYQFNAIATSLVSAQTSPFTISAGAAAKIQAIGGTPQSTTVFGPFAVPLQVLVTDSNNNQLSGVTVTFTAPATGASAGLSAATATTDAAGHASVTATANSIAGAYTVTASVSGVTPSASFTLTNLGGAGSNLVFTTQPADTAAGTTLAPVVVRFTDNGGNPVSGVTIALSVQGGPGTLSGAIPVATDTGGLATFSNLSIDKTGTYALQATDGTRFTTSVSFVVSPGTSSSITVVAGNGQSAAVATSYASQLKASVQDAQGNGVPNVTVTFSAPASGPSVSFSGPATVATDSTGVAAISVTANSQVGSFQVNAAAASASTVFSLTNVAGTASQLKFLQQPTDAVAGAVIAPPITVRLIDSVGNSVAMAGVAVTLSLNPTTGRLPAVSGTTTIATDASGLAAFAGLSINTAGSQQFTAIAPSLVSAQSNAFTITAGVPAAIQAVSGTPQSTTVLAPFAVPLQALVTDSNNNPLSGVTLTFTAPSSGATATLSAAIVTTDANGYASVSAVAGSTAGSYTVTASVSGVTPSASFALTNASGTGANLVFTQQPANTASGAVMGPVTVRVTDNGGNPIGGVTISLTAQGGSGVLSGATPVVSNPSGLAAFTSLSIDRAGTYVLQATDGTHFAISSQFLVTAGTASSITVVSGSGQSVPIGSPYPSPLKASVQDAQGNGVAGIAVTFAAPGAGPSVSFAGPATVVTDSTGVAATSVTANSQIGAFQVTATAPGTPAPAVFSLTNITGSTSRLSFVQQPSDAQAGATLTPVTVQITDSAGNNNAQAGVAVTLLLNPLGARLRTISGTTTVSTDASGLATFNSLSVSTAGRYQLTATAASLASAQSNIFQITAGAVSAVQATGGTPQTTTVLAPFAIPLQALVTDLYNNPIGGVSVTFTPPGSGASATISPSNAVTDAAGHASVTATGNSVTGSYTVTAAATGVTSSAVFVLTNVSGVIAGLSFTQQPVDTPAGTPIAPVVVRLTDGAGNGLPGVPVTQALAAGAGSLFGTLSVNTGANGNATFSDLRIDTSGTYQLVASAGGIATPSGLFQIGPAVGRSIAVSGGSGQSAAAGDPYATPLKAIVRDGLGNAVPGAQVTFTAPASGASVTFTGSATVTTGTDGIATSPFATANSQPGLFVVVASTAGASAPVTFNLQNLPTAASGMQFIQQPTNTVAGNAVAPAVSVQIVDRFGNTVSQSGVSISLLLIATTAVTGNVTGTTAQTDSTGLAKFPNLSIAQAGSYQLLALATGFASVTSASFQVAGGLPGAVTASAGTPQSATIRTIFPQPFVALVTDTAGNPLSGAAVTFTAPASGASGTFSSNTTTASAATDVNGLATAPAFTANTTIGAFTVTAAVATAGGTAAFAMANLGPDAEALVFLTPPSNANAGAAIAPAVRVQIQDNNGQPVNLAGVAILMTLSQGTGTLSGTYVQTTDANGVATFSNLSIDIAGAKRLRALGTAQSSVESNPFQVSAGAAASIVPLSGSGQIANAMAQFPGPLQVLVEDALGNPSLGVAVTFALPSSGASGTFAGPATTQTGADGIATSPLITANSIQGVISATASAPGVPSSAQFSLAVIEPSGGSLRVNPANAQFVQAFGGTPPLLQTASIVSISGAEIPWTAVSSAPWLTVSPISGTTPSQIALTVNGDGMAPGQYGALAVVSDAGGNQQNVLVSFTLTGTTALVAQPSQLAFVSVVGADAMPKAASPQTVQLTSANSLVPISYRSTVQVQTPEGGKWLAVSPAVSATPGTATVAVDPTGLQAGIFAGFATFTPDDTTIGPVSVPVTLVVGCGASGCPPPQPAAISAANAASFHPGGSPGAQQTIFGSYLATSTQSAPSYPLPASLAGTQVLVNGIAAPLYYVSPTQINFQMPAATAPGSAQVVVVTSAGQSPALTPSITPVQPGLFVDANMRASALNADSTVHTPQTPIPAGGFVALYLTGMGPTTPPVADGQPAPASPVAVLNGSVKVTIGGLPANVSFAGLAPGFAGLVQVNAQIPAGLVPGDQPVFVAINGVASNTGLIAVK